jgi:hypothetical protein
MIFHNSKIGTLIRKKYNHYYDNNIESKWTLIELIITYIKVGKSQSFITTTIQFSIQLVGTRTIHHFQGLSLDELVFDPTKVFLNGLTYITSPCIQTKNIFVSSSPT